MKALSVRQPWAWLLAAGHKDVENRTWATPFRGWCLIHAPATYDGPLPGEVLHGVTIPGSLPRGGIVGIMRIVDCCTQSTSPWFDGPFGFVVDRAHEVPLVPCRGMLGFFEAPASVVATVQLHRSRAAAAPSFLEGRHE